MRKRMVDALHATMRGLHTAGASEKQTLRSFELRAADTLVLGRNYP